MHVDPTDGADLIVAEVAGEVTHVRGNRASAIGRVVTQAHRSRSSVSGLSDDEDLGPRDALYAFDDADQGVTHVIRGEDLFDFTPVQVILQHLFGLPTPIYHHHRLIRDDQGKRLATRDDARAIAKYRAEGATPADFRRMVGLPNP